MPTYERGDYIKVEFSDGTTGVGEWMWVCVDRCDDEKRIGKDANDSWSSSVNNNGYDFRLYLNVR